MSFADDIWQQAKAHQECYIANLRASDGENAQKLARLIARIQSLHDRCAPIQRFDRVRAELLSALEEAKP